MKLRNRVVMAPMRVQLGSESGAVTQRTIGHYVRRAAGGAGLIIVEAAYVAAEGRALACVRAFVGEGAKVVIVSRIQDNLDHALDALGKQGFEVVAIRADLTQAEDAKMMVAKTEQQLGPVDVLVNSAGAAKRHTIDEYDEEGWRQGMNAKYFPCWSQVSSATVH